MATTTVMHEKSSAQMPFRPVEVEYLRTNTSPDFDIFIQTADDLEPVLYRERNLVIDGTVQNHLRNKDITDVFVPLSQAAVYQEYLEESLETFLSDDTIDTDMKTEMLYSTATHMVQSLMDNPNSEQLVSRSENLVDNTLQFIGQDESIFASFLKTGSFDYKTYTHSVNVMMYSMFFAQHLELGDKEFMRDLGIGTLLHDIGKSKVSNRTLNHPGKLNEKQWAEIKMHPEWGCDILEDQGITNEMILDITMHHHEKLTGTGYPHQLPADEIRDYVRAVTICDIFDALTTKRSYKGAADSFSSLEIMRLEMHGELDGSMFKEFIVLMSESPEAVINNR
jgi:putative nucleotidyltransferase with HDIG domain